MITFKKSPINNKKTLGGNTLKKSLILTLALVFVLGITGSAFAANPFTDVPANHWAYGSIAKLAQGGIIDGYGDGTFVGNNTMTRYEMAQIVAKAMARSDKADAAQKAQIEKLAAEFADELDALGVRVAKLEKYADKVKITGEARFQYYSYDKNKAGDRAELRSRIWLNGEVNDRWSYVGMFENKQNFKTNVSEGSVTLRRAWVEGSIGVINVQAGRFDYVPVYGTVMDSDVDGIKFNYSQNKWDVDVFAIRPNLDNTAVNGIYSKLMTNSDNVQVLGTKIGYGFTDKLNAALAYYHVDPSTDGVKNLDIFELGVDYAFTDKFNMWANYVRGDNLEIVGAGKSDYSKNGYAVGVNFGNVEREKVNSWGLRAAYYNVPAFGYIANTSELSPTDFDGNGFKGWTIGGTYVLAKNISFNVDYFDYKGKENKENKEQLLWTYVNFYF